MIAELLLTSVFNCGKVKTRKQVDLLSYGLCHLRPAWGDSYDYIMDEVLIIENSSYSLENSVGKHI